MSKGKDDGKGKIYTGFELVAKGGADQQDVIFPSLIIICSHVTKTSVIRLNLHR